MNFKLLAMTGLIAASMGLTACDSKKEQAVESINNAQEELQDAMKPSPLLTQQKLWWLLVMLERCKKLTTFTLMPTLLMQLPMKPSLLLMVLPPPR